MYKSQVALTTPFNNSVNGFDSFNAQEAIEEAIDSAFAYYFVELTKIIKVKQYRQMIVHDELTIDGQVTLDGNLSLI